MCAGYIAMAGDCSGNQHGFESGTAVSFSGPQNYGRKGRHWPHAYDLGRDSAEREMGWRLPLSGGQ